VQKPVKYFKPKIQYKINKMDFKFRQEQLEP